MTNRLLTREFLSKLHFRQFTKSDWMAFQGCESPMPMIAEQGSYVIIIDGDCCDVYLDGYEYGAFESCESIRDLK